MGWWLLHEAAGSASKRDGYLLGSYRIATAPEPNSSRLTSCKSTCFDSPVNNVGPWPASLGCTTNSYSSINPSSVNVCGSFTPPTNCRRMLGSGFEADDAVQETMVRAWCHIDGFEGRSSLRSWLYRIATNVCIDMRRKPERRAIPIDLGRSCGAGVAPQDAGSGSTWVPSTHARGNGPHDSEPAELAASREAVRHAFVAALLVLPPRQRAVLILREVLRWHAREVADLLGTTVASVNSALQRARATRPSAATPPTQRT